MGSSRVTPTVRYISLFAFPYPAAFLVIRCCNISSDATALKVFQNRCKCDILCILLLDVLKPLLGCRNTQLHHIHETFPCDRSRSRGIRCPGIGDAAKCICNDVRYSRIVFYFVVLLLLLVEVAPLTTCQLILFNYVL